MSKTGSHYVNELERKFNTERQHTPDDICIECGLRLADHLTPIECPTCPLCGKPSPVGEPHKECMDYEAMMADRG